MVGTVVSWASRALPTDQRSIAPLVAHTLASAAVAAAAGLLLGVLGQAIDVTPTYGAAVLLGAVSLGYSLKETGVVGIPTPQRRQQVPNSWRWKHSRLAAGSAYGAVLGAGFLTYIHFASYLVVPLATVMIGRPLFACVAYASYGMARTVPLLVVSAFGAENRVVMRLSDLAPAVHVVNGIFLAFSGSFILATAL